MTSASFASNIAVCVFATTIVAQTPHASAQCQAQNRVSLAALPNHSSAKDIVDTAVNAGSFKTLVAAVEATGLVDALKAKGPFTVFAPTDTAFAKLPAATLESLLKPENREQLRAILLYHVVGKAMPAEDVTKVAGAATLNGQRLKFALRNSAVHIDNAKVVTPDIECTNGVIHVIDTVILPSSDDIVVTAEKAGSFTTLLTAATKAGLVDALKGKGPLTVFAPTDEAFAALPPGTLESLLKPENKEQLAAILKYHVVAGRVFADDAAKVRRATTLQGADITFEVREGRTTVNGAEIAAADINAANGVIHVIDRVILPPNK